MHKKRDQALTSLREAKQPLLKASGIEDTHDSRSQKKLEKMAMRLGIPEAQNPSALVDACNGYFSPKPSEGLGKNDLFPSLGISEREVRELFTEAQSWATKA